MDLLVFRFHASFRLVVSLLLLFDGGPLACPIFVESVLEYVSEVGETHIGIVIFERVIFLPKAVLVKAFEVESRKVSHVV